MNLGGNIVRIVAVVALVAQAMTPWSIFHHEMSKGPLSQDASHLHCPHNQAPMGDAEAGDGDNTIPSACERACGLSLSLVACPAFLISPNLSESIITQPDTLRLYVSTVPKPPPIA